MNEACWVIPTPVVLLNAEVPQSSAPQSAVPLTLCLTLPWDPVQTYRIRRFLGRSQSLAGRPGDAAAPVTKLQQN